ncbi:MAG: zinc-ribbon domain-containing protein [Deltaproteobacteria bacterium]|nr:zinc-ribbon domain-containing protein [Deltaproteobacteria bacterium]
MKARCPECGTAYRLSDEEISEKGIRAICRKCGAGMILDEGPGGPDVPENTGPEDGSFVLSSDPDPETGPWMMSPGLPRFGDTPVSSMSPPYPRHRDAVIIVVAVVLLVLILVGGYLALRGAGTGFEGLVRDQVGSLFHLVKGGEAYNACETFIREHKPLFSSLGDDLDLSFLKQETRFANQEATSKIMLNAQGDRGSGRVFFQLRKEGETWKVISAALEEHGRFRTVYPTSRPGARKDV